jgi:hypothetical protein
LPLRVEAHEHAVDDTSLRDGRVDEAAQLVTVAEQQCRCR